MRICGRTLRPSTLAERRIMLSLGIPSIRVPRGTNPFVVARRLARLARIGKTPDGQFITGLATRLRKPIIPQPSPEPDTTEPIVEPAGVCAA